MATSNSDPIVSSIKAVRRGKSIQDEGEFRLRQLLPNASKEELERVSTAVGKLIDDAAPEPVPEPAPVPQAKPKKATGRTNGKAQGKPFDRNKILKKLLTVSKPFTSQELAKMCGLASAQALSPLLTSLKRNDALKRRKKDGEITWERKLRGLKQYIKFCEEEAAAAAA